MNTTNSPTQYNLRPDRANMTTLTPIVHRILNDSDAMIDHWQHKIIRASSASTVVRFSGNAENCHGRQPWAIILKILHANDQTDPGGSQYSRRECDAYASGMLANLPGGLRAPRCYRIDEYADSSQIWLESVSDAQPEHWSMTQFVTVARHLGQFNGAWLAMGQTPNYAWLSRDWIRADNVKATPSFEIFLANRNHPYIGHTYPGRQFDAFKDLWAQRGLFLDALDGLPQTICHLDASRDNLLAARDHTVAVDWASVGLAPLGVELVALVWASLRFCALPAEMAAVLDRRTFAAYIQGLRDVGWHGDVQPVRRAYTAALTVRWLDSVADDTQVNINPANHTATEAQAGRTLKTNQAHIAAVNAWIFKVAQEARSLMPT